MRARKASKPAAADTARELRGSAKLDQLSARKLPRKKCSLQVAVYDGRLRLGAVRPRQARRRGARRARPQPWLVCQHRQTLTDAAILKSIGTVAGIPDIVVVYRGRVYAREENGEKERSP
jgi:hypothetical protein